MERAETCSCSLCNKLYTYLYHHIFVLDKYIQSNLVYQGNVNTPYLLTSKGKGKSHTMTRHDGTEGGNKYTVLPIL